MRIIVLLCLLTGTAVAEPWKRHTIDPSDKATGKRGADGVRLADVSGDEEVHNLGLFWYENPTR